MPKFTFNQMIEFLKSKNINPHSDILDIEDAVSDYLVLHCFDENYKPNNEGLMCEAILDHIGELDEDVVYFDESKDKGYNL